MRILKQLYASQKLYSVKGPSPRPPTTFPLHSPLHLPQHNTVWHAMVQACPYQCPASTESSRLPVFACIGAIFATPQLLL